MLIVITYRYPYNLLQRLFPNLNNLANHAAIKDQWARESCEDWYCFNLFLILGIMDWDKCNNNYGFLIGQADKIVLL